MMRAKKGMIAENMSEIGVAAVIVIIAVVLLSIAANLNKTGKIEKSQDEMNKAIIENTIALFLKQPVQVDGYEFTMAELMALAADYPGAYENRLKEAAGTSFISSKAEIKVTVRGVKDISLTSKGVKVEGKQQADAVIKKSDPIKSSMYLPSFSGKAIEVDFESTLFTYVYAAEQGKLMPTG
jgi:hypothetical protein